MSHIVTINTLVRDATAVQAACRRLNLAEPVEGKVELFGGSAQGLLVQLPDWVYPVVCNLASGQLQFDNFEERWGAQTELDRFLQTYACEKAKILARQAGHTVTEQQLTDGSVKLTVQVQGGAAWTK